jgi:hypothetical protein
MNFEGHGQHENHIEHRQNSLPDIIGWEITAVQDKLQPRPPDRDEQEGKFDRAFQSQIVAEPVA